MNAQAPAAALKQRRDLADAALAWALCGALTGWARWADPADAALSAGWLSHGLATALIATAAPRARPATALAVALVMALDMLLFGPAAPLAVVVLAADAGQVIAGAWLLARSRRTESFDVDAGRLLQVLARGCLIPTAIGAAIFALLSLSASIQPSGAALTERLSLHLLGATAVVPCVLSMRAIPLHDRLMPRASWWVLALLVIVVAASAATIVQAHHPFLVISAGLVTMALIGYRHHVYASAVVIVAVAWAAIGVGGPRPAGFDGNWALAAWLALLPAQLLAAALARQRALAQLLTAVGTRSAKEMLVLADLDGVIRWVNATREEYWGIASTAVIGRHWQDRITAVVYETIVRPMLADVAQHGHAKRTANIEYPVMGWRTMDLEMRQALDETGVAFGVLMSAVDVSRQVQNQRDLERMADELRTSNEGLAQFVRIASHDLREPLNTIAQFVELIELEQAGRLEPAAQRYFEHIHSAAQRMKVMLDDVLQLAQLDGPQEEAAQVCDLDEIAAELRLLLSASLTRRRAELIVAPLGRVRGHRSLLMLVLQNLLSNATKFVPADRTPRIELSTERSATEVRIHVRDNGIGIPEHRIAELGVPFRRLHARRHFDGTGLGLATCRRIAELHGGRLEVRSSLGIGSCFSLVIPKL